MSNLTWRSRLRWGAPFIVKPRVGMSLDDHEVLTLKKGGRVIAVCHMVRRGEYHELIEVRPVIEEQPVDKALERFRRKLLMECWRWCVLKSAYRLSWPLIDERL
ncbi:hypothetical protein [Oleidesulfovibrio sp.]|uniref:hypothetical protein n=1 Tax=Oleidesulfovibrio sp. TaxID=2909707 RepID=UPI003A89BB55